MFPKILVPQNGWFIMDTPIKMDDFVVPLFLETPISGSCFTDSYSMKIVPSLAWLANILHLLQGWIMVHRCQGPPRFPRFPGLFRWEDESIHILHRYMCLQPFDDPCFDWNFGLVLGGCWPSKIEVIGALGVYLYSYIYIYYWISYAILLPERQISNF